MTNDSTYTIFLSAKKFFSGTLVSRITGLLRDMAMASAFGTSEAIAAFMVAFRLSQLLRRILGEGCLQSAFIPQFEEIRNQNSEKAYSFFNDILRSLSFVLLILIFVIMTTLILFLQYTPLQSGNKEILWLTFLLMPSLLFICLFGLNASLLQCEKCYFTPSIAPSAFNIIWILGAFYFSQIPTKEAMPWLAVATVFACFCQWLITVPQTRTLTKCPQKTSSLKKTLESFTALKRLGSPLFLGIIGVGATQINSALDAIFSRYADPRGPALLWYAIRIEQLPLALFGIALSGALLPPLSRAIKAKDEHSFHHFLDFAIEKTILFLTAMTAGLFIFGALGIHLLYGRGDFKLWDTIQTTYCLWFYAIGLLPSALILILAPSFYARGNYATPTCGSLYSIGLNIISNSVMIAYFGWGAASIALSTSLCAIFNCLYLAHHLRKEIGFLMSRDRNSIIPKVLKATFLASFVALLVEYLITGSISSFALLTGNAPSLPDHLIDRLVVLIISGACFLGIFQYIIPIFPKDKASDLSTYE